jgi:hypothetical protein
MKRNGSSVHSASTTSQRACRVLTRNHVQISSSAEALSRENVAGCVDLSVVHRLGGSSSSQLLFEKEEGRPLVSRPPASLGHLSLASA